MRNLRVVRILWIALAVEVGLGVIGLLISRAISSLVVIVLILGFVGGIGFALRLSGLWLNQLLDTPRVRNTAWPSGESRSAQTGSWNVAGLNLNLSNLPEHTEALQETIPLETEGVEVVVNVGSGGIRVVGQAGLSHIQVKATRHVWARDAQAARPELDKLQIRHWQEGHILRLEAGDPDQGFVIGRGARIDLEIALPPTLTLGLTTSTGEIAVSQFQGDLSAKTTFGNLSVEGYNSGRNINLNTTSGRVNLQSVAAGSVRVKAGAGLLNLVGVGAEQIELESTAGSIRGRGINCGRYLAHATTGSVELYGGQVEFGLDLRAGAGRVQAEDVRTPSFRLEATSGMVFYRGVAPVAASEVSSLVGSIGLVLSPGTPFNLEARSNVGTVETLLPVSAVTNQSRNAFEGQVAGGGALLKVTSQVGTIRVSLG